MGSELDGAFRIGTAHGNQITGGMKVFWDSVAGVYDLFVIVGKAGADFKRQFTVQSYKQFFLDAGYEDVRIMTAEGRIPCAVATMTKKG